MLPDNIQPEHDSGFVYDPKVGGCRCHNKTFCPDLIFSHIDEDDVPVYYRRDDLANYVNLGHHSE